MNAHPEIGRRILAKRAAIAAAMIQRLSAAERQHGARFGIDQTRFEQYAGYDVAYLAYALETGRAAVMEHYVRWLHSMLCGHGIESAPVVSASLANLGAALHDALPENDHPAVDGLLEAVKVMDPSAELTPAPFLDASSPHAALADHYLQRLLEADRFGATKLIRDAAASGVEVRRLYLDVFEPVQREIGRLWQIQQISVAREHFASATTQMAMSQLYERIFDPEALRVGRCLVAACIGDELHEIGLRMVADLVEMAGWDSIFLGANTPTAAIAQTLRETGAEVLALSCSMVVHVEKIRLAIAELRQQGFVDITILVGGYPFNLAPELAELVGADGTARDAERAAERIVALVPNGRRACAERAVPHGVSRMSCKDMP